MPTTKDRELSAVNDQRDALLLTMDAYYEIKVSHYIYYKCNLNDLDKDGDTQRHWTGMDLEPQK